MAVLTDRQARGMTDEAGREASPLPTGRSSVELGTENQTRLIGGPATGDYIAFAPAIDQFLKAHLFGDIFGRDNLDWQSREIATVAALAALDGVESQLQSHFGIALNTGLTETHLRDLVAVVRDRVGQTQADRAGANLDKVLAAKRT
jgi:alkylhydroperoxidase/carboxymuconolactone decarboxylase family protein YurZ